MSNNGTLIGSPTFAAATPPGLGQAVQLNGTSQYVTLGAAFRPAAGTPWTVDFRGTVAAPDATNRVAFGSAQVGWLGFAGGVPTANVSVAADGSDVLALTSAGGSVADGAGHNVRLVVTGTTAYLFVDGAVAASAPCAYHLVTDAGVAGVPTLVGTYPTGVGTVGNNYLAGTIAELALYTTALTTAPYAPSTAATAYDAPGLANLYRFDGDATDSVGVPPPVTLAPAAGDFWDTGYAGTVGGTVQTGELARLVVTTDATAVRVTAYSDLYAVYAAGAAVGVRATTPAGAVTTANLACTQAGSNTLTAALPGVAGTRVEFVNGQQQTDGAGTDAWTGTYVASLAFTGGTGAAFVPPAPAAPLVVYGDSIEGGGTAAGVPLVAWPDAIRATYAGTVQVEAYGGRSLRDDAATPAAAAAFAARLASYAPAKVVACVGVNDYVNAAWTAAAFGAAYGSVLDALHAARPGVPVAAVTPVVRMVESANANGDTLAAFRSAVTALGTTRPWVTVFDGSTVLTTADLGPDGTHPTAAGQAKLATFYLGVADALTAMAVGPATIPAGPPRAVTVSGVGLRGRFAFGGTAGASVEVVGPVAAVGGRTVATLSVAAARPGTLTVTDAGGPSVTLTVVPATPTAPAVVPASGSATIAWAGVAGAATYALSRTPVGGGSAVPVYAGPALSAADVGLTNGTAYAYTVTAVDAAGNASAASPATTVTPAVPDPFAGTTAGLDGPYTRDAAVTPSDTTDLPFETAALSVTAAGTVTVKLPGSPTPAALSAAPGTLLKVRATRVYATGTTAGGIVALA